MPILRSLSLKFRKYSDSSNFIILKDLLYEKWFIVLRCGLKKKNQTRVCFWTQFTAHVIQCHVFFPLVYFRSAGNPHLEVVQEIVLALQSDRDQDVSFFATLEPKRWNSIDTTMLENQN